MSEPVPREKIEEIVGHARHPRIHYGRAVSETETFYILHSQQCLEQYDDLSYCPFSIAMDLGLNLPMWAFHMDQPVPIGVYDGELLPLQASEENHA